MHNGKSILAVIPARGGSKRIPNKNIIDLAGKPLVAWTIEHALNSKYIDRVIVSTDSYKISTISKQFGADVPFLRPVELAIDEATSIDVVVHAINELEKQGETYDFVILLQPTSPLRTAKDIDESIELLGKSKNDSVISVCEAEHNPLWSNVIPDNDSLVGFLDDAILNKRSQDLDVFFRLNGAIYLCKKDRLVKEKTFFLKDKCIAYKMSRDKSVDIDNSIDLSLAHLYITRKNVSNL